MPVADTEFLFGMRDSDPKHQHVKCILDELERTAPDRRKELVIPPMALFELVIVCMSENKAVNVIIETLELIKDIASSYKLEVSHFNFDQLIKGLTIYRDLRRGFFDSLLAGSALTHDNVILGDDDAFLNIPNLKRIKLAQYSSELRRR
ncbi:PIN domain-containing protein [Candidatus Bathyarchaeota archaeon]|nr:PIN domain-containing protein [Candidatus Bathyarchaeota archaeon]MBS7628563.1 PIN domain-containing protein [Candidatus Bathyarchaeota archaeon]